jgi:hypothetical protein
MYIFKSELLVQMLFVSHVSISVACENNHASLQVLGSGGPELDDQRAYVTF